MTFNEAWLIPMRGIGGLGGSSRHQLASRSRSRPPGLTRAGGADHPRDLSPLSASRPLQRAGYPQLGCAAGVRPDRPAVGVVAVREPDQPGMVAGGPKPFPVDTASQRLPL